MADDPQPFLAMSPEATQAFGALGNIVGLLMLISPLPVVIGLEKSKTPKDELFVPYFLLFLNSAQFTLYGFYLNDPNLYFVNAVGLIPSLYCSDTLFALSTGSKITFKLWKLFGIFWMIALGALASVAPLEDSVRESIMDKMITCLLLGMCTAPLINITKAIRSRDHRSVPITVGVASTVNSTIWAFYGMAKGLLSVTVPNWVGAAIGLIQVIVFFTFIPRDELRNTIPKPPKFLQRFFGGDKTDDDMQMIHAQMLLEPEMNDAIVPMYEVTATDDPDHHNG